MLLTDSDCALDVERGPDWLLVTVKSLGSPSEIPNLADRLWELLERHFTHRLVVEFDRVESLHRRHLAQLVELRDRIEAHGGVLRVCGLSEQQQRVLRASRPGSPLPSYRDRVDAVMCGVARRPK